MDVLIGLFYDTHVSNVFHPYLGFCKLMPTKNNCLANGNLFMTASIGRQNDITLGIIRFQC